MVYCLSQWCDLQRNFSDRISKANSKKWFVFVKSIIGFACLYISSAVFLEARDLLLKNSSA